MGCQAPQNLETQSIEPEGIKEEVKPIVQAELETPSNILLIIADDLGLDAMSGFEDYGERKPNTPNLDRLRENGLVFENLWSNPVCSPTRAGILTGKYGVETGVTSPVGKNDVGIRQEEVSLQSYIAENASTDYAQAIIGKWHLSTNNNGSNDNPGLMGVPHYSGLIGGGVKTYYDWNQVTNGVQKTQDQYITSVFTDEAIAWTGAQEKPWFLWLAYTAPHTPFHLPPKDLITDQSLDGSDIEERPLDYYLAAIEAMDSEIGRLLETVDLETTTVMFIGDNGSPAKVAQTPFSRQRSKGSLYQGGINVPMIVSGAGVSRRGIDSNLVNTTDFFPTIAELAGIDLDQYESGFSFADLLATTGDNGRDFAYSEISSESKNGGTNDKNGHTIRDDRYKYMVLDNGERLLFDLANDPYERQDLLPTTLSAEAAERLALLQAELAVIRGETSAVEAETPVKPTTVQTAFENVQITTDDNYRYIKSNGIPNHETGAFPNRGNPHTISEQEISLRVLLNPVYTGAPTFGKQPGVAINGVKFEPGTAEFYEKDRNSGWNYEAIQAGVAKLGLDQSNAHVQPTGEYHYHAVPTELIKTLAPQDDGLYLVGYAADGHAMYYEDQGTYQPSYRVKEGTRASGPGGAYNGTFTEDFEYVEGLGNLDRCNGINLKGKYVYMLTDSFPYIPRCLNGEADPSFAQRQARGGRR